MPVAISAENLSKKYLISHQQKERYTALRDVIAGEVKALGRRLLRPFAGNGTVTESASAKEEFWALKDINFEIHQGDRVGIIGRNGAGKSTLLKILSRITEPATGRVTINGRVASLLEVGTGFHPELTGRENIYLNGAILGMTKGEISRKFDEIVDFAEVEKFLDTPVKRYSSGMYVRLAFAVAAHVEPDVLLIDEVLAVGDTNFQKRCLGKMNTLSAADGRTVVFVSHNMQAVRQLCNRTIVLADATLAYDGPTSQAIDHYFRSLSGQQGMRGTTHAQVLARGAGVALRDIRFLYPDGTSRASYERREIIKVQLEFELIDRVSAFDIAMAVVHSDGTRIFSEALSGVQVPCLANAGTYLIDFEFAAEYLKLEGYYLTVAFVDSGTVILHVDGIPLPEILDSGSDPILEARRWGVVRIPVSWGALRSISRTF